MINLVCVLSRDQSTTFLHIISILRRFCASLRCFYYRICSSILRESLIPFRSLPLTFSHLHTLPTSRVYSSPYQSPQPCMRKLAPRSISILMSAKLGRLFLREIASNTRKQVYRLRKESQLLLFTDTSGCQTARIQKNNFTALISVQAILVSFSLSLPLKD